jgi:hypothetical protein
LIMLVIRHLGGECPRRCSPLLGEGAKSRPQIRGAYFSKSMVRSPGRIGVLVDLLTPRRC